MSSLPLLICSMIVLRPLFHPSLSDQYLVSASVRGTPAAVLDVLVNGSSNTTILGPASKVELIDGEDSPGGVSKSVSAKGVVKEEKCRAFSGIFWSHGQFLLH